MIEKILDILKIILEKYMIPGLIALAISLIVYANTPQDFSLFVKLGQTLYITLFFAISFLIVLLIIFILNKIIIMVHDNKSQKKKAEKTKNALLDIIDSMDPQSKKIIEFLLKHNNKQIIIFSSIFLPEPIQHYCDNSTFIVEDEIFPMNLIDMKPEKNPLKPGIQATKIKLKEDFYNSLRWLEAINGSISRFK